MDLRRLESTFPADGTGPGATTLRSGLLPLMVAWTARWGSATTLLGVIAVGPIVVAVAALAMVILLVVARRRPSLELPVVAGHPPSRSSAPPRPKACS